MALIKCKECGAEISSTAKVCPHCGAKIKKPKGGCILYLILGIALLIIGIIWGSIDSAGFKQIGYYKNHHYRVFSIYTSTTNKEKIKKYAQKEMWSPGGITYVLFFNNKDNTPDVTSTGMKFNHKYDKYLIAQYIKFSNGKENFTLFHNKKEK